MTKHEFVNKYFIYQNEVHQVKRVNTMTLSTYGGLKIEKKFVWNAIIGECPIAACDKYIDMLRSKMEFAKQVADKSGYDSDRRYAESYSRKLALAESLRKQLTDADEGV